MVRNYNTIYIIPIKFQISCFLYWGFSLIYFAGKVSEGVINARKMMTYLEKYAKTLATQWPDAAPAPAPAPALELASRTEKLFQN